MSPASEMLPYVVLLHAVPGQEPHYDLLLSVPGQDALTAFRLSTWPPGSAVPAQFASRLPDHRRVYLTYEGPLSGNRGEVRRIDAGTVQYRECSACFIQVNLRSDHGDQCRLKLWTDHKPGSSPDRDWKLVRE